MAHFAELESKTDPTGFTSDTHLVVKRVVVVGNDCVTSDEHADGEAWCVNFFGGGTWKQTSYNNNFRKSHAGIGYTYDEDRDAFIPKKPFNSWILNEETCQWEAPVVKPDDGQLYNWNEINQNWDIIE